MKKFICKVKKATKDFFTNKSAFSLVELIVVIAIMAVMAAVLAPALLGYVERSRAQKDDSAMGEVTNAIQLSLADQNVYDELLQYSVKDNYSCYCDGDTSTNINTNKITTKEPDLWLFNDQARLLDETIYKPAGKMRGVTVTLKPNGEAEYILKDGIVNKVGDDTTKKGSLAGKTLADCPEVYNRLRSTVGDTIKVSSQTYRNSDYTIFISMGTTGGNQADKQDAIKVYGQYNGTNLPEVAAANNITSGNQDVDSDANIPSSNVQIMRIDGVEYEFTPGITWGEWLENCNYTLKDGTVLTIDVLDSSTDLTLIMRGEYDMLQFDCYITSNKTLWMPRVELAANELIFAVDYTFDDAFYSAINKTETEVFAEKEYYLYYKNGQGEIIYRQ